MKKFFLSAATILLAVTLCSCANHFQPVIITSSPPGATVTIFKENGVAVQTGQTPMIVNLEPSGTSGRARYKIEASKLGYARSISTVEAEFNGRYFGRFLLGGLIGASMMGQDSGAMWKFENTYSVNLEPERTVSVRSKQSTQTPPEFPQIWQNGERSDREAPPKPRKRPE